MKTLKTFTILTLVASLTLGLVGYAAAADLKLKGMRGRPFIINPQPWPKPPPPLSTTINPEPIPPRRPFLINPQPWPMPRPPLPTLNPEPIPPGRHFVLDRGLINPQPTPKPPYRRIHRNLK